MGRGRNRVEMGSGKRVGWGWKEGSISSSGISSGSISSSGIINISYPPFRSRCWYLDPCELRPVKLLAQVWVDSAGWCWFTPRQGNTFPYPMEAMRACKHPSDMVALLHRELYRIVLKVDEWHFSGCSGKLHYASSQHTSQAAPSLHHVALPG